MNMTYDDVRQWILSNADKDQLDQLSSLIRSRRDNLGIAAALSFKAGDPVWFDAKTRGIVRGKFISLSRKNAKVQADGGGIWTVSPHLLNKGTV